MVQVSGTQLKSRALEQARTGSLGLPLTWDNYRPSPAFPSPATYTPPRPCDTHGNVTLTLLPPGVRVETVKTSRPV
ncbi:hypothetical protein B5X24_HaOG205231 [Helicoverpa armigera]|uniref:Uncharacterized protein n=1 Tax=Helicoverpa armigera TaxID=29058 RepID=A0A2W1BLU9_HELAM|nr:hypothetical protein B5X24_HaOG205231 [Helicoverpa armigera]